jgi:NAD(P)-dependent dehydrogenase (short-subunit alcohol dehydrogenase family)
MDLGLAGATAVVAGGSRGMGLAAARCFAIDGARVAVLARTRSSLDEAVDTMRAAGSPDAIGIPTDLTRRDDVEAAFAQIGERWGALNILVNAAGPVGVGVGPFERPSGHGSSTCRPTRPSGRRSGWRPTPRRSRP